MMSRPDHPPGLADADARKEVRTRLDAVLFVEAGAGSGKTSALVSRIVELVCSSAALLGQIAAVTFTEAAAAELRVRVRTELEAAATRETGERARFAEEALDGIDTAVITTIHGFCQHVLAEHPIEAGLPPRFEVLDEVRQSLAWRSEWERTVDLLAADDAGGRIFEVASLLGLKTRRLEELARTVASRWDVCEQVRPDLDGIVENVASIVEREREPIAEALERAARARAGCSDVNDRLFSACARAEALARLIRSSSDWRDLLALLSSKGSVLAFGNGGQPAAWGPERAGAQQELALAMGYRRSVIEQVSDLALPALAGLFDVHARSAAAARAERGELLFHDLLVLARDLLARDEAVRRAVRSRFRYLLIDEFQDTDPLQLEIAELIGRPAMSSPGPDRPFRVGDPEVGRLFYVGDPQQSIYRFRGADLAAYLAARQRFAASGRAVTALSCNFRSVPGVLSFVNECFKELLPEFRPLTSVRSPLADGPVVHVVGGPFAEKLKADEQRRQEAADCVALIRSALRDAWQVEDEKAREWRALRLGDIALLLPRRTGLGLLEEALDEAGIGYRIESAELIYRSQEARELLALCRAIDAPGDRVALMSVLRSSLFRCADDELYEFHRLGGSWSLEDRPPEVDADPSQAGVAGATGGAMAGAWPVVSALRTLGRYRAMLDELGPIETFELALRERHVLELATASLHPREGWRRVRFLTERLRAFVAAGGGGLSEFADWVDDQLREGLRPVESVLPEPDEDVVRVMTVHGAKGLEFPVAVLVGFGTTEASNLRPLVLRNDRGACEVHFNNDLRTSGHARLYERDRQLEEEEELRLLYVAATRARDHLVVCAHHAEKPSPTIAQRLFKVATDLAEEGAELFERVGFDSAAAAKGGGAAAETELGQLAEPSAELERYRQFQLRRAELVKRAARRASIRATEVPLLAGLVLEPWETADPDGADRGDGDERAASSGAPAVRAGSDGDRPPAPHRRLGRLGRAGTRVGRAVHASLQSLSQADARLIGSADAPGGRAGDEVASRRDSALAALRRICTAQARAEQIGDRSSKVERLSAAALSSPTVVDAFASGTARREIYVSTSVDGTVLDGFVDLCYVTASGGLVVVDYKTDAVRDVGEVQAKLARYELQAAAYALALADATGRPVERAVLVFLSPPHQPIEMVIEPLGPLAEKVRALVAAAW